MDDFLQRMKQRKLVQWALAYIAAAFALIQVIDVVAQRFGWPALLERVLILALVLGFVVTLVIAWYHGEKGAQKATGTELLILALLLGIGGVLVWRMARTTPGVDAAPVAATTVAKPAAIPDKSIAVLAFTDLSPGHDQGYFSDGMAEEILNALAQVKDLKVAGRTSSFYYKDHPADMHAIGQALGVANILEGSVRKQGNQVRITAQLIRVADDRHLWSQAYDGDLSDVFKLQENIARAITDQLQVVLTGGQKARLVAVATTSPEAHSLYLQATSIFNRRDSPRFPDAIADLQQAIALDPKFARAHSRLAALYAVQTSYSNVDVAQTHANVMEQARAALALDPTLAEPHAAMALSWREMSNSHLQERDEFEQALRLDPDDVTSNFWFGLSLITEGYHERGIALLDHALAIDPMMPNVVRWRGIMYMYAGDLDRAEQYLKRARSTGLSIADRELAFIAFDRGDAATAIRQWPDGSRDLLLDLPPGNADIFAAGMFGDASAKSRAMAVLDAYLAKPHAQVSGQIPVVMILLGQPRRALELLRTTRISDSSDIFVQIWSPLGKPIRALPEFPALLKERGLVELWDKYGPPDLCRKNAAGDYACH
ncbi:MAG: tetratricopeptide repeat protein [Proteobacteria bacterium]|nr:tetratricopeptide repeat protein [Pseudomonadota bacterium]